MDNYKIKEVRETLIAIINGSELPLSVIYLMLQGLTAEAEKLFNKQALEEQFAMQNNKQTKKMSLEGTDIPTSLNDINPLASKQKEEKNNG